MDEATYLLLADIIKTQRVILEALDHVSPKAGRAAQLSAITDVVRGHDERLTKGLGHLKHIAPCVIPD